MRIMLHYAIVCYRKPKRMSPDVNVCVEQWLSVGLVWLCLISHVNTFHICHNLSVTVLAHWVSRVNFVLPWIKYY